MLSTCVTIFSSTEPNNMHEQSSKIHFFFNINVKVNQDQLYDSSAEINTKIFMATDTQHAFLLYCCLKARPVCMK